MAHIASSPITLPEPCSTIPARGRELLTALVSFSRGLAIRQGQHRANEISFHLPQYVIARFLGIHESTLRRWLKHPAARYVVATCEHKQDGRHQRITSGTIFSVRLNPDGRTKARLNFERGLVFRDLDSAREEGRVRDTYTPEGKTLLEELWNWVAPVVAPEDSPPVDASSTPVDSRPESEEDALRDALSLKTPKLVERAARAISAALGDSPNYLPAWYRLLWNLTRSWDSSRHHPFILTFSRYRTAYREGLRSAAAQLLNEATAAGWR